MTNEAIMIQLERINKAVEEMLKVLKDIRGNTRGKQ